MGTPRAALKDVGCTHVYDSGGHSFFLWWPREEEHALGSGMYPVLVILYADDFVISGQYISATTIHYILMMKPGFSKSSLRYVIRVAVGLEREDLPTLPDGTRRCFVHQIVYTKHLLAEYRESYFNGAELRHAVTPMLEREEKEDDAFVAACRTTSRSVCIGAGQHCGWPEEQGRASPCQQR